MFGTAMQHIPGSCVKSTTLQKGVLGQQIKDLQWSCSFLGKLPSVQYSSFLLGISTWKGLLVKLKRTFINNIIAIYNVVQLWQLSYLVHYDNYDNHITTYGWLWGLCTSMIIYPPIINITIYIHSRTIFHLKMCIPYPRSKPFLGEFSPCQRAAELPENILSVVGCSSML